MSGIETDAYGAVLPSSVDALSPEDLRAWVVARLHGKDLVAGGAGQGEDMPHYLIASLYPRLARPTRADLQLIVLEGLRDLVRNPASEWRSEAGGELLMLVEDVLAQSAVRDEAVGLLLEGTRAPGLPDGHVPSLQSRALQALIALRHLAPMDFWREQFDRYGDSYAPLVLDGLSLRGPSAVFDWIAEVPWTDTCEVALLGLLPSLLEDYGTRKVLQCIEDRWSCLLPQWQASLRRFCEEEGIVLPRPRVKRARMFPVNDALSGRITLGCGHQAINRFIPQNQTWREERYGAELFLKPPAQWSPGGMWAAAEADGLTGELDKRALTVIRNHLESLRDGQDCGYCSATNGFRHFISISKELMRSDPDFVTVTLDRFLKLGFDVCFEINEASEAGKDLPHWEALVRDLPRIPLALDDWRNPKAGHMRLFYESLSMNVRIVKLDWEYYFQLSREPRDVLKTIVDDLQWSLSQNFDCVIEGVENDACRIRLCSLLKDIREPKRWPCIQGFGVHPVP